MSENPASILGQNQTRGTRGSIGLCRGFLHFMHVYYPACLLQFALVGRGAKSIVVVS